ncbi:MAG: hypothetical protein R2778_18490 [Saprospiraceae bacterium]
MTQILTQHLKFVARITLHKLAVLVLLSMASATIMGCGGNGGPHLRLSDPGGTIGPTANNLLAGEYVVTVTDANGCTSVVDSVFVTEPAEIVVTQDDNNTTQPHCFGDSEGAIAVP